MEEARGWGDIGAGRSLATSKRRALLDPSPHPRPQKKSLKLLEEEQQIPSPEGTGEIHCLRRSGKEKSCCSGSRQYTFLGLDLEGCPTREARPGSEE